MRCAFELGESAVRCENQDLMAEVAQLAHGLAQGGDDAINLGNERLGEKGNTHRRGWTCVLRRCNKAITLAGRGRFSRSKLRASPARRRVPGVLLDSGKRRIGVAVRGLRPSG